MTRLEVSIYHSALQVWGLVSITQEKLRSREFDPANIPSQLIRLILGILAGGSIVFFPDLLGSGTGVDSNSLIQSVADLGDEITIRQGTVAFILGYAVDIFYSVLDNIGGKIKDRNK